MADFATVIDHPLLVKLLAVVGFVGATYSTWKYVFHFHHLNDNAFSVPFEYVKFFGNVQGIFQFFYVLQHFSKESTALDAAHKSGLRYFFWALWYSLWAWTYHEGKFWLAFVFNLLQVLTLLHLGYSNRTHTIASVSRWWFIHFAIYALPTAFSHVTLFHTFFDALDWHSKAAHILSDVLIWWFFFFPAASINLFGDWGTGLVFSYFAWGFYSFAHHHSILHWFTLAIAVLDSVYTFAVGYPDVPSESLQVGHRGGEHAPLLGSDAA